jgi:hypothetical protein
MFTQIANLTQASSRQRIETLEDVKNKKTKLGIAQCNLQSCDGSHAALHIEMSKVIDQSKQRSYLDD